MMKRICSLLLTLALVLGLCACGQKAETSAETNAPTWQEQYDLGIRYLSEGNYQEAILAFTAAIEIDPKRAEAYLGRGDAYIGSGETADNLAAALADYEQAAALDETNPAAYLGMADVYIRMGEYDKALEILRAALEKTGNDAAIADKIAEMEGGSITDASGKVRRMNGYDGAGNLVWYHLYDYDAQGRESAVTSYDGAGNQTGHVEETYDADGHPLVDYWYFGDTGEVGKHVYEYNSAGQAVKEQWYDLDGTVEEDCLNTYDAEGNLIRVDRYGPDGESWGYWINTYKNGEAVRRDLYEADGRLDSYMIFGDNRTDHYNSDGTLAWSEVYLYDEQGNYLGYEEYDGDGALTYSAVRE